jgi:hypothetical protein
MNLSAHFVAAFALGIGLFHNVVLALVVSIGALLPDLDREYFYVARGFWGKYQIHRALLHNFVVAALLYIVSPFLALGALSHYFLDIFTSASDRGAELLFPFTRFVSRKLWLYDIEGNEEPNKSGKSQWWVEDPYRLIQHTTDPDMQEPEHQAWKRIYGPFKNGRIVDWGIFSASLVFLAFACVFRRDLFVYSGFSSLLPVEGFIVFFVGIVWFFKLGEWYKDRPSEKKKDTDRWLTLLLTVGLALLVVASILEWKGNAYSASWPSISTGALLLIGLATLIGLAISYVANRVFTDRSL